MPGEPDLSKPQPNAGTMPPRIYPKVWFASERVLVGAGELRNFGHDRGDLTLDTPGFHIFGPCPSCGHATTGLCATEFLSLDLPVSQGAQTPVRVRSTGAPPSGLSAETRLVFPADYAGRTEGRDLTTVISEILRSDDPAVPRGNAVPMKTMLTVLRCACVANHVPPTAGAFGCGSEWLVRVTYDPTNRDSAAISPVTPDEAIKCWPAADAAAASVPTTLTTAQASAGKWQTGLTAIIALLGVSALLGNRATIMTLSTGWVIAFAIAAALAVAANIVVLLQSDLASFGLPRIRRDMLPSDLQNADLDPLIQARQVVRKLRASAQATGVAVVAAVVAVAIVLLVHPDLTAQRYKVTTVVGNVSTTTSCGTITSPSPLPQPSTAPTAVTFKPDVSNGVTQTITLGPSTSIVGC